MKKRCIASLLIFILTFSLGLVPAFASSSLPIKGTPPPGIETPIGTNSSSGSSPVMHPLYGTITYFLVTGITGSYNGYNWMGWKVSGGPGGTVTLSHAYTVSNSFSSNFSIAASLVSAAVGFNVTYSTTMTASYSHNVSPGKYGFIGYDNWYHVKTFSDAEYVNGYKFATGAGTAQQWFMYGYQYGETSSSRIFPPNP